MTPSTALVIEYTSVAGNILFTYLIGRELRVGWLFGFVASVLGIILYGGEAAWLMAALNGFYAAMGSTVGGVGGGWWRNTGSPHSRGRNTVRWSPSASVAPWVLWC
ncbi:MAG: hypothetical protein IPN30_07225 [Flavobacteriales bacterium]|nr:hypothetical protein [Flavobacteriales bacterium]